MSQSPSFHGTFTALVTPFRRGSIDAVDGDALDALVDRQIEAGVAGLVPCGTTGEAPTLSEGEKLEVLERVVARARRAPRKVVVVAGVGSNCTRSTVDGCRKAERAGVDAVMVVCPYYNKPSQEGLLAHFRAAAESVGSAVVVYNIPGRTAVDLLPETLEKLCESAPNVLALKEATGQVLRAQAVHRALGDRIAILSGDDALTLPIAAAGGRGVISVTSNLLPREVVEATRLALEGPAAEARRAHEALLPVHEALFLEPNPAPVKAALAAEGVMSDSVRLPLVAATEKTRGVVRARLEALRRRAS